MICEKCNQELPGGTVICRGCGHNNVLRRIDIWREKRSNQMTSLQANAAPAAATTSTSQTRSRATSKDGTIIMFPKQPQPSTPEKPAAELPAWRQQLNARVKEIREQKSADYEPPQTAQIASQPDRNPIIEAALNRINRATYLEPTPRRRSGQLQAAFAEPIALEPIVAEAKPAPVALENSRPFAKAPTPLVRTAPTELLEIEPITPIYEIPKPANVNDEQILEDDFDDEIAYEGKTVWEVAPLWKRLVAALIDAEIVAVSYVPLILVFAFFGGKFEAPMTYLLPAIGLALLVLYFFLTYALAGRTLGMAMMKLHLASLSPITDKASDSAPDTITFTFQQAAMRALGGSISLLCFPLNMICLVRSYDRLSISDYLSHTQIVRIKS